MQYNKLMSRYTKNAGKITVLTALSGLLVFAFMFAFNFTKQELQKVEAQSGAATTTLTVLNTPPIWVVGQEGMEQFESSTTSPTNSGNQISWVGTATDANADPYYLIICSTSATPTAVASNVPVCNGGTRWAVSTSTVSGTQARAATTTLEAAPFGQVNTWYAWVCDDDTVNPRCSTAFSQGTTATNTSPFYVNPRPIFTAFSNNGPVNPGQAITFMSTSSDAYTPIDADIYLVVCSANTYSTTTNQCGPGDFLASTTASLKSDASATFSVTIPTQDDTYNAYGYIHDQFGHEAIGATQGSNVTFTINNVAPNVLTGDISLNGGNNITLSVPGGETTGFTLNFTVTDNNSCENSSAGDEITGFVASVFRSGVGSTTCNGTPGSYDPTSCYPSGLSTATWNLSCNASSTSCTGPEDDSMIFNCTFPLWFVADPTDGAIGDTPFYNQTWAAAVAGVDDNNATGTMITSSTTVELVSFVALNLLTNLIAYDQLEPGDNMDNLTASTTLQVLGNTGLNQELGGDSMCGTYTPNNPCPVSSTSTIPQNEQEYATSTVAYGSGTPLAPTSSPALLDIRIPKPTSTSTPTTGVTYWGIAVPGTINLSGSYTGRNIFLGLASPAANW